MKTVEYEQISGNVFSETYFPRGGTKPKIMVKKTLFGKAKSLKKKSTKKKTKPVNTFTLSESLVAVSTENLKYKNIHKGMIVLGAVREIQSMYLNISLPGQISARAPVTDISSSYNRLLQMIVQDNDQPEGYCTLNNLFECGQHVICKITEVKDNTDSGLFEVTVSLSPDKLYSDLRHNDLSHQMLLTAAVSSIEDHGYVMDLGVKNCRAFLPKSDIVKTLNIGQLVWCEISKITTSNVASTVTLNAIDDVVFKNKIKDETTLNKLFPGMMVDFTVNKILSNGLQGTFLNDFTGYIHETQLKRPLGNVKKYQEGQTLNARVLYIMPTTKFTYFTLQNLKSVQNIDHSIGDILEATVLSKTGKGLFLSLSNDDKGYVSYRRLNLKTQFDKDTLPKCYRVGSKHKCRIIGYDYMDRVYICTFEKEALNEKIFTFDDVKLGSSVTVVVNKIGPNGINVTVGNIYGFIHNLHLSDIPLTHMTPALKKKFIPGQKLNARILNTNPEKKKIFLTLKQSLVDTKLPCLSSYNEIEERAQYDGFIVKVTKNGLLVAFYGNVKGWVPKSYLSIETIENPEKSFNVGQVVKCTALRSDPSEDKLILSLINVDMKNIKSINKGKLLNGRVNKISDTGLQLMLNESNNQIVFLPTLHLTDDPLLAKVLLGTYSKGDIVNNLVCVDSGHGIPIVSLRDFQYFMDFPKWNKIQPETIVECSVHSVSKESLLLHSPIKQFEKLIIVPMSEVGNFSTNKLEDLNLQKYQSLTAKIVSLDRDTKLVTATTKLSSCWDGSLKAGINLLTSYINDINRIHDDWVSKQKPLVNFSLGERVKGTVLSLNEDGSCSIQLKNGVIAYASIEHFQQTLMKNDEVNGTVIWLDYANNSVLVTLIPKYMNSVNPKQVNVNLVDKIGCCLRGVIILVRSDIIVAALKGSGNCKLIVLPAKLHKNDIKPSLDMYKIGDVIKIILYKKMGNFLIGLLRDVVKLDATLKEEICSLKRTKQSDKKKNKQYNGSNCIINQKRNLSNSSDGNNLPKKKSKIEEYKVNGIESVKNQKEKEESLEKQNEDVELKKQQIKTEKIVQSKEKHSLPEKKSKKTKSKKTKSKNIKSKNMLENEKLPLSGADNFWNLEPEMLKESKLNHLSNENDEENEEKKVEDKKKMTKAERAEAARNEEKRIREIEERLADTNALPTSADQFDRLVISKPNSSMAWIGYMAYHLQSTEIEKARAIAKKALDTISFREEQEKLNVWLALLNLENRYGTKESFSTVLEEALRMNDALTVHTRVLTMLADTGKQAELQETLNVVTRKYKNEPEAWLQAATACFTASLLEKARNLLQRALCSLDKKQHIDFIVKFALLETKHGDIERSETLFEQVLTSYPRRVDVWIVYVDMLIKAKKIDIARKVLARSVSLQLPARKMKTLFKKFIDFEQNYGNEEKVSVVRKLAAEYVQNATE